MLIPITLLLGLEVSVLADYTPIQLVAPSAVTMAVATDAMICTMNLNVSLFVIISQILIFNLSLGSAVWLAKNFNFLIFNF